MTSEAKSIDLIFFMIAFLLKIKAKLFQDRTILSYCVGLAGLAAMNPHTPVVALGLLKTHPQPRTLGQGCVLLQKWCWQVVS